MKGYLILEDGTVFEGRSIGAEKEAVSEIVFNTSMTGYLEVLTDPSYAGQAVCMTYPLIGNYGVTEDGQSDGPWPDAFLVRELCKTPSNFRSNGALEDYLAEHGIPGLTGLDTRALTKLLRDKGTMNGLVTTKEYSLRSDVLERIRAYRVKDVVKAVTTKEAYTVGTGGKKVALLDLGMKRNIAASLASRDCTVKVWPAFTKAEEILSEDPDGIMLSNGPGDPKDCGPVITEIRKLADSGKPMFAICLGHQLMALAMGGDTYKLKYGHRGGNHPVRDLTSGRVYITSQNHGYAVDAEKLDRNEAVPGFLNVNDGTNEGLIYTKKNIFTVQFHPEACPGPQDCGYLFDRFIGMM